jgi:ribosomal protein L37AE/L43A
MNEFLKQLLCWHYYLQIRDKGTSGVWLCTKCGKKQIRELADFY